MKVKEVINYIPFNMCVVESRRGVTLYPKSKEDGSDSHFMDAEVLSIEPRFKATEVMNNTEEILTKISQRIIIRTTI